MIALLAGFAVHYLAYRRFLAGPLRDPDLLLRRAALIRWARFAVGWQLAVLILDGAWIAPFWINHARGLAWAAPAIGLLVGTALPLQLVALTITRASRR